MTFKGTSVADLKQNNRSIDQHGVNRISKIILNIYNKQNLIQNEYI